MAEKKTKKVVNKRSKEKVKEAIKKTIEEVEETLYVPEEAVTVVGVDLAKGEDHTVVVSGADIEVLKSLPPATIISAMPSLTKVREATVNIAGSTPTKDFAVAMCKIFDANPDIALRVRYIGAGSGHQLTKATIEANKLLLPRGQMLSRFDFWTNEDGKSVNNVRFVLVNIMPNSLAQALSGQDVEYIKLDVFMGRDEVQS